MLPYPSTYDAIRAGAEQHPDDVAFVHLPTGTVDGGSESLTYGDLFHRATQTANLFRALGVSVGDTVSILLPNLLETQLALWGASAAGVANPINGALRTDQIAQIMTVAGAKVLVTQGAGNPGLWEKAEHLARLVPSLQAIVAVDADGAAGEAIDFRTGIESQAEDRLDSNRRFSSDDLAAYFHTGGTTGSPKLAQHTHGNEVSNAWTFQNRADYASHSAMGLGLPLFHVAGLIICSLAPLLAGKRIVILGPSGFRDRAVVEGLWGVVEQQRMDMLMTVPTVLAALLDVPTGDADVSSLRLTICGASPVPMALTERWEERFGHPVWLGYGLTEGTCVSTMMVPGGPRKPGSVGRALAGQELMVTAPDDEGRLGPPCPPGEIGVVCVRGPNVFPGYKQAERNTGVLLDGGWLNTGDLGRLDDEGYLWITGRAKDLIKRGGHGIDPADIEEALAQHPAVLVAAAVGKPDAYTGELPVAYVQLQSGTGPVDPEEIRLWCKEIVADPAACPVELIVVDAMPVSPVGKISKVALRRDAARRVIEEQVADAMATTTATWAIDLGPEDRATLLATVRVHGAPNAAVEALRRRLAALPVEVELEALDTIDATSESIDWRRDLK